MAATAAEAAKLSTGLSKEAVFEQLRQVEDPELHYNIVDLGLIYGVRIDQGMVVIDMTFTSPMCPVGPFIVSKVEEVVKKLSGVTGVTINIVWEPLWSPDRMSDEAKVALGI
ncbi:metal-sulfur cluster assembly factor [Candidatus Woesearchaeota archaeon]|nr:metal-sulfur cluster assembly factor [Candidatus Woesearchaeota archaeon]